MCVSSEDEKEERARVFEKNFDKKMKTITKSTLIIFENILIHVRIGEKVFASKKNEEKKKLRRSTYLRLQ